MGNEVNFSSINPSNTKKITYPSQTTVTTETQTNSNVGAQDTASLSPAGELQQKIAMLEEQKKGLEAKLASKKEEFGKTLDAKTKANGGVDNSENMTNTEMAAAIDAKNRANNINENTGEGNRINNEVTEIQAQLTKVNQQISMLNAQLTETTDSSSSGSSNSVGVEGINTNDSYTPSKSADLSVPFSERTKTSNMKTGVQELKKLELAQIESSQV